MTKLIVMLVYINFPLLERKCDILTLHYFCPPTPMAFLREIENLFFQ